LKRFLKINRKNHLIGKNQKDLKLNCVNKQMAELKENDVVLCIVERIEGTTVFVSLPDNKKGTIVFSEIAPGRIKNIRAYAVPRKKLVCKILRISKDNVELSLRRVNAKEKKQVMEIYNQEHTINSAMDSILKEKSEKAKTMILGEFPSLFDFISKAREDIKLIEKYIPGEFKEQIKKLAQKKKREVAVKKTIRLKCLEDDGIVKIRKIFSDVDANVAYISAGNIQVTVKAEDYKTANQEIEKIISHIANVSKENKCEFSAEDKK